MFALGHSVIFITQVLYRTCNMLLAAFQSETAERVAICIMLFGQYVLPFALWLLILLRMREVGIFNASQG